MMRHVYWSRDQLLDYQYRRLKEIVKYAYDNVPFYHEKFRRIDLRPEDIRSIKDLNKLPIIRRSELQENVDKIISKEFDARELKRVSTSGSSGRPLFTYITDREDAIRKAKLLRANTICGQKPRDRWAVITASQHQPSVYRIQKLLGMYVPIPVSVFDDAATQISKLERIKPDVLDGYSSSLLLLAKEVENRGIKNIKPRIIIGGAELIDASSRRFIQKIFDAPFYDEYACVELERLAWQCEERSEYHIDADSVIMQFVDENGEEVAPGEMGEIVCTSLFNYAMPFIRYAVGDIGKASDNMECACGRTFPLMKIIEGRKDSIVHLPDGRTLSPLALGWAMEFYRFYPFIDQYRFIQERIDLFKILIKVRENSGLNQKVMEVELIRHLKKILNLSESEVIFDVEFVEDIPLDRTGKFMKVISQL
ncbi:MAG: phenylacetate--CoA ligase family protein [Candidatus Bathyarchaeia archaeon]